MSATPDAESLTPAEILTAGTITQTSSATAQHIDELRDWSQAWWRAWADHDAERIAGLVHENIVYEGDPSMLGELVQGRGPFQEFVEMVFRAFPDLEFEQLRGWPMYLPLEGVGVAFPWRASCTFTGDMRPGPSPFGLAPTGGRIVTEGVDLYEVRDGLLFRWRAFANGLEMLEQVAGPGMRRALPLAVRVQRWLAPLVRRRSEGPAGGVGRDSRATPLGTDDSERRSSC